MAEKLTDKLVKSLAAPPTANRITYDDEVKGFGCRVTAAGTRAFILNYRTRGGRERRFTIGDAAHWKVDAARQEAKNLKRRIDNGEDPLEDVQAARGAKTVAELCERFIEDHLPKKRPNTRADYQRAVDLYILPALKHLKIVDVSYADIDGLHRKITKAGATYRANRVASILSKMFSLAIRWGWRTDNPAKGIERNDEHKRQRYLSADELKRLTKALAEADDPQAADIIRLLLLTGARRGEVLAARWADIDLEAGVWTKPGATTKQRTLHRVPLSGAAKLLLTRLRKATEEGAEFVFPGRYDGHRVEIKYAWADLCKAAGIKGARIHDLRHTYASVLASAGMSLPVIGALLGHTQPATTHRYAHLLDDPLRQATERAAAIVTGEPSAEIVQLKRGRHA
jgi:integrase